MTAVTPLCLLLAGGKSRRMGGGDKNLIMLGDRPLLAHVIARAVPEGAPAVINANGDAARFERFGLPVIADVVDGFAGPLAGVLTGLEHAAAHHPQVSHVISLATDAPFLPVSMAGELRAALVDEGLRKIDDFTARFDCAIVDFLPEDDGAPDPFTNLNTPEDLEDARIRVTADNG